MINLFFSYSHKDEALRNELDKHLSILKRQGIINAWHDRCIHAGADLNKEISKNIQNKKASRKRSFFVEKLSVITRQQFLLLFLL